MGTPLSSMRSMRIGGVAWPKLRKAPDEHIAPNVPVVTTSTRRTISAGERVRASWDTSSAVRTTALP
jgi:hypothetical protein